MKRVYASLPLSGPASVPGREVLLGARLALEARAGEAELVVLDSYETSDRDEQAVMNAREAVEDPACLAYIGDFHSSQVLLTAPLLGTAQLLQIAPVATFVGLDGPTLVRLMPNDAMGATAIAAWLREQGVQDVLVVHDLDADYGEPVGAMSADAATRAGLVARRRPVWDNAPTKADLADAEAVVYAGVGGPAIGAFWDALHALDPALWLIGTDGIAVPQLALDVSPGAAARIRLFVPQRAPFAFYGLEAMTLALDSMRTGGTDRERVADSARAVRDRDSVLGWYSLDQDGLTTTSAYGRMAIISRRLVWDLDL